jgi:hypothetical protein
MPLMDARELRLAQNETIFREINERVLDVAEQHGADPHLYSFFCECANSDCTLQISLTTVDYERVRSDGASFVVAPGHELPEVEHVVESNDGWSVVAKEGDAATYARRLDPRGRDKP